MRSIIFGLAVAMLPWAAQAGETVTYTVGEEQFEGYRAAAKDEFEGICADHPRLGRSDGL